MPDQFNISPAYIISYLKDIEKKLQRNDHSQYPLPHYIGGEIPVAALNNEAKKMMDFVGLTAFTPDCCWEELGQRSAGFIELTGSKYGAIKIHLSSRYKNNGYATIAILAHEICHKLLEFHGLYFPELTQLNETYTDLCTIYVGFTQMIVNGYNTTVGNTTFSLGYLTQETFEKTISIVELIQGRRPFDPQWMNEDDVFSQLARWIINPDKRKAHIEGFAKKQRVYAGLSKRISILKSLLDEILKTYNSSMRDIEQRYFIDNPNYGESDTVSKMPITLFWLSHPELFRQVDDKKTKEVERLSLRLDKTIRDYVNNYEIKNFDFQSNIHYCPFCKTEIKIKAGGQKWNVIQCKKCGNKFAVDLSEYHVLRESVTAQPTTPTSTSSNKKWWKFWQ
ncbi:MAG: hypothetical protein ACI31D_02020 [Candidatus Limisoma sp.]